MYTSCFFSLRSAHKPLPVRDLESWEDTDIQHSHEEVRNHSNVCSLLLFGFCCSPVQSIQNVLAKWREQTICHLTSQRHREGMEKRTESAADSREWNMVWTYLQHVVDDVEFDDGLPPDEVVHHGVIYIAHHWVTQHHNEAFQHITHLGRLE